MTKPNQQGVEAHAKKRRQRQRVQREPDVQVSADKHPVGPGVASLGVSRSRAGALRRAEDAGRGGNGGQPHLAFDAGMLFEGGTVEAQAEVLQRLDGTQRQKALRRIARVQGNQHVQRVVAAYGGNGKRRISSSVSVQTKLEVGRPDDVYEQEADTVADEVMRMPSPAPPPPAEDSPSGDGKGGDGASLQSPASTISRLPVSGDANASPGGDGAGTHSTASGVLARAADTEEAVEEEGDLVEAEPAGLIVGAPPPPPDGEEGDNGASLRGSFSVVDADLEERVGRLKGSGSPLPPSEREFFESRFGVDFGDVRVHSDGAAAQTAEELGAQAYTVGSDVAFNKGEYAPGTERGRRLMAHELTHVVQQGRARELSPQRRAKINRCITPDSLAQAALMKPDAQRQEQAQPSVTVRAWVQGKPNRCTTPDCLAQAALMQMPLQRQVAVQVPISPALQRKPNHPPAGERVQTAMLKAKAPFQRQVLVRVQASPQLSKSNRCTTPDCQTQTLAMKIAVRRQVPGGPLEIVQQSPAAGVPQIQRIGGISIPNPFAGLIDSLKGKARAAGERIKQGAQNAVTYLRERGTSAWNNIKERGANAWNDIRERGTSAWETLKETAATSWATVKERSGTAWEEVKSCGADAWETVQTRATTAWETVQERAGAAAEMVQTRATALYEGLQNGINTAVEGLRGAWENLKSRASTAVTGLWDRANDLVAGIREQVEGAVAGLQEGWAGLKERASELVGGLQERAQSVMDAVQGKLGGIASSILSMDAGAVQSGWADLQGMVEGAWQGLQELGGGALNWLQEGWGNLRGQVTETLSGLGARAQEMLGNLRGMAQSAWEGLQGVWEGLKGRAAAAFEGLKARAQSAWEGLKSLGTNAWNGLKSLGTNAWNGLKSLGTNAWNGLKSLGTNAWNGLKSLGTEAWSSLRDQGTSAWNGLKSMGETAWNNLKGFGEALWGGLKGEGEGKVGESKSKKESEESGIRGAAGKVMGFLGSILSGLKSRADPAISNLVGKAREAWSGLKERATGAWTGLREKATGAWTNLKERATGAWTNLKEKATGAWTWLKEKATGAWTVLKEQATGAWTMLKDRATDAWNGLKNLATDAWNGLKSGWEGLKALGTQAWEGIKGGWEALKNGVGAAWDSLKSFASDAWEGLKSWATSAWEGIKAGWNWLKEQVKEEIQTILDGVTRLWKAVKSFAMGDLVNLFGTFGLFLQGIKQVIENPDIVMEPLLAAIGNMIAQVPAEARAVLESRVPSSGFTPVAQDPEMEIDQSVFEYVPGAEDKVNRISWQEHLCRIWLHLQPKLEYLRDNWLEVLKTTAMDMLWPWEGVASDWNIIWAYITSIGDVFSSITSFADGFNKIADWVLGIWRQINAMLGRLYLWFLIASVLIGAIVGAIFGGVGALPGAAAGLEVAAAVGKGLLISTVAAEGLSIVKAVADLGIGSQTRLENEVDYEQISSSVLTLAIIAVLLIIGEIAKRLAKAVIQAIGKQVWELAARVRGHIVELRIALSEQVKGLLRGRSVTWLEMIRRNWPGIDLADGTVRITPRPGQAPLYETVGGNVISVKSAQVGAGTVSKIRLYIRELANFSGSGNVGIIDPAQRTLMVATDVPLSAENVASLEAYASSQGVILQFFPAGFPPNHPAIIFADSIPAIAADAGIVAADGTVSVGITLEGDDPCAEDS